ncbi:MAG: hypothetical protein QOG80_3286 [Pseudonocardiales bacterium]|jgi:hypothetical protein|nr:hypothetical protein [Pseudonocardiales bacterium]
MSTRQTARRGHLGRVLLVVLVALVGLLVAADRIGLAVAERTAAVTLQSSQHLAQRPSVSIAGFPFLTQLATGSFDSIHVTVRDLTVGQRSSTQLRIARLDVTLRQVHVSRDFSSARSQFGTATALIDYSDLSHTLGATFTYAGNGRVQAVASVGVIPGVSVPASAAAAVRVSGDSLTFNDPRVTVAGQQVPPALAGYFNSLFGTSIPLTGLPFGVHVTGVRAASGGVTITLSATGLTFRR